MQFSLIDIIVVFFYLIIILLLGIKNKSKERTLDSYFLGNKTIPWYTIMLSIVATETSSLTFLGVPGIAYQSNFNFLQIALGFIIGRTIVASYILPMYIHGEYTSIYKWVGNIFGVSTQKSMSGVFLVTRILSDGVRLYAVSIPISLIFTSWFPPSFSEQETGILAIIVISLITILYSSLGGFKSVVTTDAAQFFLYTAGGFFAFYWLLQHTGWMAIIQFPQLPTKLSFFNFDTSNLLHSPYYFFNALLGGVFISVGSHGVDQMIAQRALACKNETEAKKALIVSGFVVFVQFALFLSIGLLLSIHYEGHSLPQDAVFSKYILEEIPSPLGGLIVAAILASAMSTFSSSINSLSLSVMIDWAKKKKQEEESSDTENDFNRSRIISVLWGMILMISAFIPFFLNENQKGGIVVLGLKISSLTLGPMIGIFILARMEKHSYFRKQKIKSIHLILPLLSAIFITSLTSFTINPAFTLLIPLGILLFLLFFLLLYRWV